MEPTAVQLQILKQRYPGIGEPALRRNWEVLLAGPTGQPIATHAQASSPMGTHGKAQASTLRQKSGPKLNKLETAWQAELARTYPEAKIRAQSVTLVLGNGVRYTPDFFDLTNHRAWETKGFMRDDAAVKIKMAATLYPEITFTLITKQKGGGWGHQEMLQ